MTTFADRATLRTLELGALAAVLASLPYKLFDLDRFFVPKELALILAAMLACVMLIARTRTISLNRLDQLLSLWLAFSAASALFATNWWLAERAMAITFGGAACFWCARALVRADLGPQLAAALAFAGVIAAATALLQAYGVRTELFSLNRAPGGTFGNRNFIAHLCAIILPALLFSAMRAKGRLPSLRWGAGAAIIAAALILSRSRAAWLALLAGVIVLAVGLFLAFRQRDHSLPLRRAFAMLAAITLGAGAALVIPNTLDWNSASPYRDTASSIVNYKGGSGHGRLIQYANSGKMALHHPVLGVGPGNWAVIYPKFAVENDPSIGSDGMTSNPWPSSDWVSYLAERGVPAFVMLVLAVLVIGVEGVRAIWTGESEEARARGAVLVATLVIVLIVGAFDAVLLLPAPTLIAWSLLGAFVPLRARTRVTIPMPTLRRAAACLGVLVVGCAAAARSGGQIAAMSLATEGARLTSLERASGYDPGSFRIHVRLANAYAGRGDCKKARPHADAARRLFPSSPAARRAAAGCGHA